MRSDRRAAQPIHEKSLAILRAIATNDTVKFRMGDIVAAAPGVDDPNSLRGAWAGLTRRTRNILKDSDAELVWWEGELAPDKAGTPADRIGRVSTLTHQSLRVALSIRS